MRNEPKTTEPSLRLLVHPKAHILLPFLTGATLIVLLVNLFGPWIQFTIPQPDGSQTADWYDLRDADAVSYEQALLVWPLVCYGGLFASFVVLSVEAMRPRTFAGWPERLGMLWLGLGAYAGFILMLTGARWVGFYVAHLIQDGSALLHLHLVPYLNLLVGAIVCASAIWGMGSRQRVRMWWSGPLKHSVWPAAIAAAGLLLMPLAPYASRAFNGPTLQYGEFNLALLAPRFSLWDFDVAHSLWLARLMVWVVLDLSLLSCILAHLRHRWSLPPWIGRLQAMMPKANGVFIIAGTVAMVRFYERIPHLAGNIGYGYNPFLAGTFIALIVVWLRSLRQKKAWTA